MKYDLIKEVVDLVRQFEESDQAKKPGSANLEAFKKWICRATLNEQSPNTEPDWEGKANGRSAESVISTMLVHMNRFAKSYSRSAMQGSPFSTQEDFIYLITLKSFGEMTKMELIKKNVHEKPVGIQIINRLISQGWAKQKESEADRRSKVISITKSGLLALENQMEKIRQASKVVTADLTHKEQMQLIQLLSKLNDFHQKIYQLNIDNEKLLDHVIELLPQH